MTGGATSTRGNGGEGGRVVRGTYKEVKANGERTGKGLSLGRQE